MKKKFTVIITMLLAFVMSFALMACGSPDGETPPDKTVVVQKALTSLVGYMSAAEQRGKLGYELDTAKTDEKSASIEFKKNGQKVFYSYGNDENGAARMFDLGTGVDYIKTQAGWALGSSMSVNPQSIMEYALAVVMSGSNGNSRAASSGSDFTLDDIRYNSKSNTLSINIDIADEINRLLGPIQEVYFAEGSVLDLIDAYIGEYYKELIKSVPALKVLGKPLTVNKIANGVKDLIVLAKDEQLIGFIEANSDLKIREKYEKFLEQNGVTGAELEAAKARTIGEGLEGLIAYIDAKIDFAAIAGGDNSSIMSIITTLVNGTDEQKAELLNEVLQYVVLAEVDTTNLKDDISGLFDTVIDLLKGLKIKPHIDGMSNLSIPGMPDGAATALGIASPVIKEIIAEEVTFEKLGASVVVKLNADYSIYSVKLNMYASHDYEGQTELPFLSDNDYSAKLTFIPTGFSNEPLNAPMEFAPYDAETNGNVHLNAYAIMRLDETGDVTVYHECRMFEDGVTVGDIELACVYGDGETFALEASEAVNFDESQSSFVFDASAVNTMMGHLLQQGQDLKYLDMQATVYYGEDESDMYTANVRVYLVSDASQDSAAQLIKNVFESLGFELPDNGTAQQAA